MNNKKHVAVVGGGIAGLEASCALARLGYQVTLIEKEKGTGGHVARWFKLFPDFSNPEKLLDELREEAVKLSVEMVFDTDISRFEKMDGRFELSDQGHVCLLADAVVMATGFQLFDASFKEEYGYGLFDNVITSADLEKKMAEHHTLLTRQGRTPNRVAIIHCVGSRDAKAGNTYCSKVCCITGIKQAIEINKMVPQCEVFCFYMDLRLYGSKFDALYLEAQRHHKVQFIRGRLSEVAPKNDDRLQLKAEDTLSGRPLRMSVDMVVLLVGMEPCANNSVFIRHNSMELDENGFLKSKTIHANRNHSMQEGIFMAGTCICPMSVNETLENARSAAFQVKNYLDRK
ncbi:FAD-dependent oxidoreductase [Thermophagus sp. OGC60D27]|uniref:FAD-dependent oxidoreductase n=1 Tax=Thermophagus sp. OGC60D27 TaxID=3458415 RepID=UPI004038267A